jgi:hypothetical protein
VIPDSPFDGRFRRHTRAPVQRAPVISISESPKVADAYVLDERLVGATVRIRQSGERWLITLHLQKLGHDFGLHTFDLASPRLRPFGGV